MDRQFITRAELRTPRIELLANGVTVEGVLATDIASTGSHSADRFRVTLALAMTDGAWFASQSMVMIDVRVGLAGAGSALVHGLVDSVTIDPVTGLLHLDGRDLTASFIASRIRESFANRTASEIACLLAARHGMTASVTPTSVQVGRYYQSEHDRSALDQFSRVTTEWDLLVFLAQQEGFDVYVSGTMLSFHPISSQSNSWNVDQADCVDLRLERALCLASNVEVTVRSWNSRLQSACVQTVRSGDPGTSGEPQQYVFVRPNMTPDQALKFAQTMLADLTQHERTAFMTMPGELNMTPRDLLCLTGTQTAFDQSYRIARIDRSLSADHGFVQRVQAKSKSL